ncbi:unnamed protein product, partial [Polarella glacialis]
AQPKFSRAKGLTVAEYRRRLKEHGKYAAARPASGCSACTSTKTCAHDPPKLPPLAADVFTESQPSPKRGKDGCFLFPDHPEFRPNLSPVEVLQLGSFGGTYFRDIRSAVTGQELKGREVIAEFPKAWFKGLDLAKQVCCPTHDKAVNKYKVACGVCLGQWETSGWISPLDPYGWFQWYCRFSHGRRSSDDNRQISRFRQITAMRRGQLCKALVKARAKCTDTKVSPVMRQALQHWAYRLHPLELEAHRKQMV